MKKIVCIVILILAITGLLNGISYLISGISARGIGGVNYGRVIFPLLVGAIAVYFLKKEKKKQKTSSLSDCSAEAGHNGSYGFPLWGKLSPQVTDEGEPSGHFPLIRRVPRHLPPKGKAFPGGVGQGWFKKNKSKFEGSKNYAKERQRDYRYL